MPPRSATPGHCSAGSDARCAGGPAPMFIDALTEIDKNPYSYCMRRPGRIVALATLSAAALALVGLAMPGASAATNQIANAGFETGTPSSWTCDSTDSVVTGHAHSGTFALAGAADNSTTAQCAQTVSLASNSASQLTAFVNGGYVFLGVSGGVSASNWTPSTGGAYQQLTVSFTTSAATTVTVFVHGWYGQGLYYADDVTLNGPGGGPSPTGPTGSPSPTKTPSPSPTPSHSPSPSPTPTPTGPPPNPGPLPKHELTGYWQNFFNGAKALRLSDVPTSYDLIAVAFADSDPSRPGGVTFHVDSGLSSALGGYTDANLRSDVATVHSRGQHVVLSVGGQNGTVSVADGTAATNFANSVHGIMTSFGFDGVDIDLENGV